MTAQKCETQYQKESNKQESNTKDVTVFFDK